MNEFIINKLSLHSHFSQCQVLCSSLLPEENLQWSQSQEGKADTAWVKSKTAPSSFLETVPMCSYPPSLNLSRYIFRICHNACINVNLRTTPFWTPYLQSKRCAIQYFPMRLTLTPHPHDHSHVPPAVKTRPRGACLIFTLSLLGHQDG